MDALGKMKAEDEGGGAAVSLFFHFFLGNRAGDREEGRGLLASPSSLRNGYAIPSFTSPFLAHPLSKGEGEEKSAVLRIPHP